jgi:hypothetical protein
LEVGSSVGTILLFEVGSTLVFEVGSTLVFEVGTTLVFVTLTKACKIFLIELATASVIPLGLIRSTKENNSDAANKVPKIIDM